jgi:hypothetical protein
MSRYWRTAGFFLAVLGFIGSSGLDASAQITPSDILKIIAETLQRREPDTVDTVAARFSVNLVKDETYTNFNFYRQEPRLGWAKIFEFKTSLPAADGRAVVKQIFFTIDPTLICISATAVVERFGGEYERRRVMLAPRLPTDTDMRDTAPVPQWQFYNLIYRRPAASSSLDVLFHFQRLDCVESILIGQVPTVP